MKNIQNTLLTTQLFKEDNIQLTSVKLNDINNQLKHCNNILCTSCEFNAPYIFEYSNEIIINSCFFLKNTNKSIYNSNNIMMRFSSIESSEFFIDSNNILLFNTIFKESNKSLYRCININMIDCLFENSNNIGFHCKNLNAYYTVFIGNDTFKYSEDMIFNNCKFDGNNLFEYSKNITLYNCVIESLECFKYAKNILLVNCTLSKDMSQNDNINCML